MLPGAPEGAELLRDPIIEMIDKAFHHFVFADLDERRIGAPTGLRDER